MGDPLHLRQVRVSGGSAAFCTGLPVPPEPRNRASSRLPMKAYVAQAAIHFRIKGEESKLSRVFCGSRNLRRCVAGSSLDLLGVSRAHLRVVIYLI
jgi:hypothetical protein